MASTIEALGALSSLTGREGRCDLSDLTPAYVERLRVRLEEKISPEPNTGCWLWTGAGPSHGGYGHIFVAGSLCGAHRVSWLLERGPIPEGLVLDHKCRERSCCNPAHMEPVTHDENVRRGAAVGWRSTCLRGHETSPPASRDAAGRCRLCRNAKARERRLSGKSRAA